MSKLAVGVLASMAPEVLAETLSRWPSEICSVYIHLDTKVDRAAFSFADNIAGVRLIEERHNVMWGGFSMVDAEVALMRAALQEPFEHFLLISDDSIPLRAAGEMAHRLQDTSLWGSLSPTSNVDVQRRYTNFYCPDMPATNPRDHRLEIGRGDREHLLLLYTLLGRGKYRLPGLYWTSNWKAITWDDVQYVVDSYEQDDWLQRSFRYSINPDEHYIPTLLGRRHQESPVFWKFIWADFDRDPKPYVFQTAAELQKATDEGYLFARKIRDPKTAREILSRFGSN